MVPIKWHALQLAIVVSSSISVVAQSTTASIQNVSIDWSNKTTGQQACISPGTGQANAQLTLTNVNKILYSYSLNVKSFEIASNDAGNLPSAASAGAPSGQADIQQRPDCDAYQGALSMLWNVAELFPKNGESVPLAATQAALSEQGIQGAITAVLQNAQCSQGAPTFKAIPAVLMDANIRVSSAIRTYQVINAGLATNGTSVTFSYQIDNKHWYDFKVTEQARYNDRPTKTSLKWRCGIDDVLTLSLGTMFTTLPYRTYVSQSVPAMAGTQNVLVVDGNSSISPQGMALLNYKVYYSDGGPQPGVAFSAGPVFKFGSTPSVSNFGWFAGGSFTLWRRLFLSAGMHVGQFADFPAGFHNGSVIPANFGQLVPVTRWSGRFAGGITFQTNSFIKSDKSTPTAASSTAKKQSPSGNAKSK